MLGLFHYLHVLAGTIFLGSVLLYDVGVGIALKRMSTAERKLVAERLRKPAAKVILWSMIVTVAAGITRLFLSGAIQTAGDLFHGYGLRATLALAAIFAVEAFSFPLRKRMRRAIAAEDDTAFSSALGKEIALSSAFALFVIYLMVSMRLGFY